MNLGIDPLLSLGKPLPKKRPSIYRVLTSQFRLIPDFIIFGSLKCGTSSLYKNLIRHPNIKPPLKKEVQFFDLNYAKGIHWYKAHFPTLLSKMHVQMKTGEKCLTGEASPNYIFDIRTPRRIHNIFQEIKLIAMLRNPIDMAYSLYSHNTRKRLETLSFEEAIEKEEERLSGEWEKTVNNENYYSFNLFRYSYLLRGIYITQLKKWFELFPNKNILVLKSEDYFMDSKKVLNVVAKFLNLPEWDPGECRKFNVGGQPLMDPAIRKRLQSYFEQHNKLLYDFLKIDFGWE